jgi:tetratricopeptide (TPR) repeat protein
VLLLDDLHWADGSSTALLFHLARRIGDARILVLGTYRPEDLALGRRDRRHPLDSVVNEIKRLHGEVQLALGSSAGTSGREFIDAFLDSRPNRLSEAFRAKLLNRTRGQALFTAELLSDMISRGDLVEAADGCIVEGPELDWETLPARVEGVIEERVKRLPPESQELLTVASIEGEVFCAQVIARLQGLGERSVLQTLDSELEQQHRLVQEDSLQRVGHQRLSLYRFRHSLIQRYLYSRLSQSQRELLHEDVARLLEEIHAGHTEEIAGQLARHYELARLPEQAAEHYLRIGERAMRLFAPSEAADSLTHALQLIVALPASKENLDRTARLQLALGRAQWKRGQAPESMATFVEAARTAIELGSGEYLAEAALGYDDPRFRFNFPAEPAVTMLEKALNALSDGDSALRVRVVYALVRAQGHRMNEVVLSPLVDHAIAMSRRLRDPGALYAALHAKTLALRGPAQIHERLKHREEAVQVAMGMADRAALLDAVLYRIDDLLALGDVDALDRDLAQLRDTAEAVGEPFYNYCLLTKSAMRALLAGRFEEAELSAQQSMEYSQNLQVDNAKGVYGMQMFSIRRLQGTLRGLAPVIEHFVATHSEAARWRPGLALVCSEIGDAQRARVEFEQLAADDFAALPHDSLWLTSLSYLADVCAFLGDVERAEILQRLLLPYAEQTVVVGNSITCNGAVSRNLARLAAARRAWDEAEQHFRHALDFNERLRTPPWLALTQYQHASMLIERGRGEDQPRVDALMTMSMDSARALGMLGLARAAEGCFKGTAPTI